MKKQTWKILSVLLFVITVSLGLGKNTTLVEAGVTSGYYVIRSGVNSNKVLDVNGGSQSNGANVQVWDYSDAPQKIFKISYVKNGYYKIEAYHSGKVLDVTGASKKAQTNLQQYKWNGSNAQLWKFYTAGNGSYFICSKLGTYVDLLSGNTTNGNNVWMFSKNGSAAQRWKLQRVKSYVYASTDKVIMENARSSYSVPVYSIGSWSVSCNKNWLSVKKSSKKISITCSANTGIERSGTITLKCGRIKKTINVIQHGNASSVSNGIYSIRSKVNTSYAIDVSEGSSADGANIQVWSAVEVNQQKFNIVHVSGGYYKIIAVHSGKAIDVNGASTALGTNIHQFGDNGTNAQLWKFISADGGYYYIQSKLGNYMDLAEGRVRNGQNVWTYTLNKTDAQKWRLVPTTPVKNNYPQIIHSVDTSTYQVNDSDCGLAALYICEKYMGRFSGSYSDFMKENGSNARVNTWLDYTTEVTDINNLDNIYNALKKGPVICHRELNGSHFSVIYGYNGNSSNLERSGFMVREVNRAAANTGKCNNLDTWSRYNAGSLVQGGYYVDYIKAWSR